MKKIIFLILFLALSSRHLLFACQYNVRETGFAELQQDRYTVFAFLDENSSSEQAAIERIAGESLRDSNVDFEIIAVQRQNENVLKRLREWGAAELPAFVLVSPDSQHLLLPFPTLGPQFEQQLRTLLNKVLFSPIRQLLVDRAVRDYGVVLLIEGPDPEENKKAGRDIKSALGHIEQKMDFFPKPIKHPPSMVALDVNSLEHEKVLLWGLGLDAKDISHPIAAVIYGRARWIGPLFHGEEITRQHLTDLLLVIGMDCECGLDKSWLQGTALPIVWDEKTQQKVVDNIGIDPENPLVRMEMNRIMRTGILPAASGAADTVMHAPVNNVFAETLGAAQSASKEPGQSDRRKFVGMFPIRVLLAFAGLVILIAIIILILGRKNYQ